MSLIGHAQSARSSVELFKQDIVRYGDRHRVKSGITGWAQSARTGAADLAGRTR